MKNGAANTHTQFGENEMYAGGGVRPKVKFNVQTVVQPILPVTHCDLNALNV